MVATSQCEKKDILQSELWKDCDERLLQNIRGECEKNECFPE